MRRGKILDLAGDLDGKTAVEIVVEPLGKSQEPQASVWLYIGRNMIDRHKYLPLCVDADQYSKSRLIALHDPTNRIRTLWCRSIERFFFDKFVAVCVGT